LKKPRRDAHSTDAEITAQLLGFTLGIKNMPSGTIVAITPPIIGALTLTGDRRTVEVIRRINTAALNSLMATKEFSIFGEAIKDIATSTIANIPNTFFISSIFEFNFIS
jgi:hypothetical protein